MIGYVLLVLVIGLCGAVAILLLLLFFERQERRLWEQLQERESERVCELMDDVVELKKLKYRLRAILDEEEDTNDE